MNPNELLERVGWDTYWCPDDTRIVDRPELLYLSCAREVAYLNMVLRTRASAERLPALVAEVGEAHAHTSSRWAVHDTFDNRALVAALARAGYQPEHEHHAVALHVDDFRPRENDAVEVREVATMEQLRSNIAVMERVFEFRSDDTEDQLREQLAQCTGSGARTRRFVAYDRAGDALAAGNMSIHPALGLGFAWGGGTRPEARRRGAYSALVAARVAAVKRLGLRYLGLYARIDTSAPIVLRHGFSRVGAMTIWAKDARTRESSATRS